MSKIQQDFTEDGMVRKIGKYWFTRSNNSLILPGSSWTWLYI